jgi:ABC-type sugar transport system permease subunit
MARRSLLGPLLVLPSFVFIFLFLVFPIFYGAYFSVLDIRFLNSEGFVGLENFRYILSQSQVITAIGRSLFVSVTAAAITIVVGFFIASWVDSRSGGYSRTIQMVALVPWVTSMVVGALLWKWIFASELGLYNYFRDLIGLAKVQPLDRAGSALGSMIFVMAWRTIGYSMVMLLAGLKMVPIALIESSKIDGANAFQRVIYVIIPTIRTPLLIATIVVTLSNMNNVTVPMVLTGGGPANATNVVSLELYRTGFVYSDYGAASALFLIVFALNVLLIYLYMRMVKWNV